MKNTNRPGEQALEAAFTRIGRLPRAVSEVPAQSTEGGYHDAYGDDPYVDMPYDDSVYSDSDPDDDDNK